MSDLPVGYWVWFFRGSGGQFGFRRVFDLWVFVHAMVGFTMALLVPDLTTTASSILLPLVGTLVGLSFAWAGNAQVLLQSEEIHRLAAYHRGGFVEYVYVYQTAILIILTTLVAWGLAGLKVFDELLQDHGILYFAIKILLFSFASFSLRECWHVVMGAQWMLLTQYSLKKEAVKKH